MTPPTRGTLRTAGRALALVLALAFAASALHVATIAGDGLMRLGAGLIALLALDLLVAAAVRGIRSSPGGWVRCPEAPPQPRCVRARYSALCISISREAVRSNAPARRLPSYSATGGAAAVQTRVTWRS